MSFNLSIDLSAFERDMAVLPDEARRVYVDLVLELRT